MTADSVAAHAILEACDGGVAKVVAVDIRRAAADRCWWARCATRRRRLGPPGSCRARGCGRARRRTCRRTATSCARCAAACGVLSAENGSATRSGVGAETHHANNGPDEPDRHERERHDDSRRFGRAWHERIMATATTADGPIARQNAARVVPARFSASAAVSHSSRCLCEMVMR